MKLTESFCPVCYKRIPAVVYLDGCVMMRKECKEHGTFYGVVERDADWWNLCQGNQKIFDGYMIDVTNQCNIKCKYCYHDNNSIERPIEDIVREAETHKDLAPFILTGGEPTLHKDLPEIIRRLSKICQVNLLTNGIKLCDENYLDELIESGLKNETGITSICLSFHEEAKGKDLEFLDLCYRKGIKIWTCFYVIDDLNQIPSVLTLFKNYRDVIATFRIKAVGNIWNESKAQNKLFSSDIIKYLFAYGRTDFQPVPQKISFAQVFHDGLDIKVTSWYDISNIDLWDIESGPYYKAKDGSINNLITTCLINEGIEKKKGINVRDAYPCDIPKLGELWKDGAIEERGIETPRVDIWMEQAYEFIRHKNNSLFVAELNGEIAGFVSGYWTVDPLNGERYIVGTHFYVKPEHRKSGVGKAMQKRYMKAGVDLGITRSHRQVTIEHAKVLVGKGQEIIYEVIAEPIREELCQ